MQRGVYAAEVVDALYAFTECEQSISCNLLVIKDELPVIMKATDIVKHHSSRLLDILKRELELEAGELLDEIHARTLERIFIEERVYKAIEKMRTQEGVRKAVLDGLEPFKKEIRRQVLGEDVERLLKIPIRRISLYDINKAKEELDALKAKLAGVRKHLAALVEYAVAFLEGIAKRLEKEWPRRTELASFKQVDVKEAARKDLALRYDEATGYLGTAVSGGETRMHVSPYDKILAIRRNGVYTAMTVPDKVFVDKGLLYCGSAEKEELAKSVFTIVYKVAQTGFPHIKRCRIEQYINNKDYLLVPDGAQILLFSVEDDFEFTLVYAPKPRMKVKEEAFRAAAFEEKGLKALGVRLATKECTSAQLGITKLAKRAAAAADRAERAEELFPEAEAKGKGKGPARGKTASKVAAKSKAKPGRPKGSGKKAAAGETTRKGLKARAEAIAARGKAPAAKKKPAVKKPAKRK